MFLIAVIPVDGEEHAPIHGKTPLEWTRIQAQCSRYINRIYEIPATDKSDTEIAIEAITQAAKDQETHAMVYLDPRFPSRAPGDIDGTIDHFRSNPLKPWASGTMLGDSSVFVADVARFMQLYSREGAEIPPVEQVTVEIGRHVGPVNDPAHHAEAIILRDGGEAQYRDYVAHALSETGYRQNAAQYNRGVENNLLPSDYRNSFINHIALHAEVGFPQDDDAEEYALVKRLKGAPQATLVKRWRAHSASDVLRDAKPNRGPAIIIGSGESLDDALPMLKRWSGATFCSTSHASSMVYHGCDPTYIVGYDINSSPDEIAIEDAWSKHDSILIVHPGVNPALINFWEGKKLLFREMDTSNFFMSKVLPAAYGGIIPTIMYLFSCSVAAEMSLAHAMGYSPLYLVGCDFRNTRWTKIQFTDGEWKHHPPTPPGEYEKFLKADNGEYTRPMNAFYKRSVLCVWDIDGSQCFMTSPKSIITEMPQANLKTVIEYQGQRYSPWSREEIANRAETYLAKVNQFMVNIGNGKRVVETDDPNWEPAVRQYMQGLRNALVMQGQTADDLDVEANMARFKALKEKSNVQRTV